MPSRLLALFAVAIATLVSAPVCLARTPDAPLAPYSTARNGDWLGLILGESTRTEVTSEYATDRDTDASLENSVRLSEPSSAHRQVYALFEGDGPGDALEGIVVRYDSGAMTLSQLRRDLGESGKIVYQPGRTSDWACLAAPKHGVLAFVSGGQSDPEVGMVVLAPGAAITSALSGFSASPTRIDTAYNAMAGPSIVEFGLVDVKNDVDGVGPDDDAVHSIEALGRKADAHGTMRYMLGGDGTVTIDITGTDNPGVGGNVHVTATIDGDGPAGPVSATDTEDRALSSDEDANAMYIALSTRALNKAQDRFAAAMHQTGGTASAKALPAWLDLIDVVRQASEQALRSAPMR